MLCGGRRNGRRDATIDGFRYIYGRYRIRSFGKLPERT